MIRQLGIQKVIILLLMAITLVVIYFYGVMTLGPKTVNIERQLRVERSEFNQVSDNLINLRTSIEKFDVQKDKFTNLETLGFFDPQNRVEITRRLNEMQQQSGLLSARYSINPAETEESQLALEAGYKILNTKIEFNLQAILDEEIYEFLYLLNYGFPGHVSIENLEISKDKLVTPTLLQKIGAGEAESIIQARLEVILRTLVEDPAIKIQNNREID